MSAPARLRRAAQVAAVLAATASILAGCALTDGMEAGLPAPELGVEAWIQTPGGVPYDLASLRGRHVLVEFWSSVCPHCRDEVPEIQRLHDTYGPRGLEVVSVHVPLGNAQVSPQDVARFAAKHAITYAIGYDEDGDTTIDYEYGYLPHAVLIGPDGRVAWSGSLAMYDVEDAIRDALGRSVAARPVRGRTAVVSRECDEVLCRAALR